MTVVEEVIGARASDIIARRCVGLYELDGGIITENLQHDVDVVRSSIVDPLNCAIAEENLPIGVAARHMVDEITHIGEKVIVPYLLLALTTLESEPKVLHPRTSLVLEALADRAQLFGGAAKDIVGAEASDPKVPLRGVIYALAGETDLIRLLFRKAKLPVGKAYINEVEVVSFISNNLRSRPEDIMTMVEGLISEALMVVDSVALSKGYINPESAMHVIKNLIHPEGINIFRLLALMGGYSLIGGSQRMLSLGVINHLSQVEPGRELENLPSEEWWDGLLQSVYAVSSGHGRSNNWLSDDVLSWLIYKHGHNQIMVGHLGGGGVEPVDVPTRIAALGGHVGNVINVDIHDNRALGDLGAYARYTVRDDPRLFVSHVDSVTEQLYMDSVRHIHSDLATVAEMSELTQIDLIVALQSIKPHLLPHQQLFRLSEMVYSLSKKSALVYGGWYLGDPVGCQGVILKNESDHLKVSELRMGTPRAVSGGYGTNMQRFVAPYFDELEKWTPARRFHNLADRHTDVTKSLFV